VVVESDMKNVDWFEQYLPLWKVIKEVQLTSDVTYVDFDGLDINEDKFYILLLTIKNPTASASDYDLYVEGDYTRTNYYHQLLVADGAAVSASRTNTPTVIYTLAGDRALATIHITRDPDGYFRAFSQADEYTGASVRLVLRAVCKTATVANITRIRVSSYVANAIGADSILLLCKPKTV